jgi:tetraacyldisaccharide-1-P 4'-kinase
MRFINAAKRRCEALITTAKDAVKLRALSFSMPCYVLEIEIAIEGRGEFTR